MCSYEERARAALRPLVGHMRAFGFWPATVLESRSRLKRVLLSCHSWLNVLYFTLNVTAQTCAIVATASRGDMTEFTEVASSSGEAYLINMKSFIFALNRVRLYELINEMVYEEYGENMHIVRFLRRDDLNAEMTDLKDALFASREASFGQFERIYSIYLVLCTLTLLQYAFSPLALTLYEYYTKPDSYNRYLPYRMVLPFDINATLFYEITYAGQIYVTMMCMPGCFGVDMTYVIVMIMMIRQFSLIRIILKDLDKYANAIYNHRQFAVIGLESNDESVTLEDVYYGIFSQCISHHVRLIEKRNVITDALGPILIFQMLISSIVICMTLFNTSSADAERVDKLLISFVYFNVTVMQIFLYCWYGQQMRNEAAGVGEDAYQLNWSERPKPFVDALRMLIAETAKPLYLNAMGFVNLTLPTCQGILRAALSYFTLLRSFSEEE